MSRLLNHLKNNVLVADGAIGTILYSEGLDTCPEAYNLTHPNKVERIHRSYIELSLIHISEPTRLHKVSRMPSSA